jgi:hypothetical protein
LPADVLGALVDVRGARAAGERADTNSEIGNDRQMFGKSLARP